MQQILRTTRLVAATVGTTLLGATAAGCQRAPATPAVPGVPATSDVPAASGESHAGHGGSGHAHGAPTAAPITAAARAQLAAVRRATARLGTPAAARAAGYEPMFGNVPLQGEHYVHVGLVAEDRFDVERPSVLIFAPIRGTPTLVGVAYAYRHPTDAPPPGGFDGAGDVWHGHDRLVHAPGRRILMMHAWLVEAPEGPFARYNPWLPYLAAGIAPPPAATFADSSEGEPARRLGLALALVTQPPLLFELLDARHAGLRERAAPHRAAVAALVPRLAAAERAGDRAARERLAAEAVRRAEAAVAVYRAAPHPLARRLVERTVDEFMGRGHGIEEELGALLPEGRSP